MGFDGADYNAEPSDDIKQRLVEALEDDFDGEIEASPYSLLDSLLQAQANIRAANQEQTLESLNGDAYLATATGEALDRKAAEVNVQRRPATRATGVVTFSRQTVASTFYTIPSGTVVQTESGDVQFATIEQTTISQGSTSASATVQALDGGANGNLASDRLVAMPSPPTGVSSVTNNDPTGDDAYSDTDGDPLIVGRPEESDEELRARAQESKSIGGAATQDAIDAKLQSRDTIVGVTVNKNKEDTSVNGLPPHSFEAVVYAPSATNGEIARDIFEAKGITDTDVGGVNGTEHTYTVPSDTLASGGETIHFSRAAKIDLTIDIEVVHTEDFVGSDAVKNAIVEYIGGTDVDGVRRIGQSIGENIYVARVNDAVVGEETGVLGVASLTIDGGSDGVDDTVTNSDGIDRLVVPDDQVG